MPTPPPTPQNAKSHKTDEEFDRVHEEYKLYLREKRYGMK